MDRLIKILQTNSNRAELAAIEIGEEFKESNKDNNELIALVTEPYRKQEKIAGLPRNCKIIPEK